jgi:RNA methyltransferase, TrmH family
MTLITSPSNPRISKLRDLHTARGRKKSGLFLMEGIHLLEALLDAGIVPQEVYYQAEVLQHSVKGRALFARLVGSGISQECLVEVNERVMQALGDVQTTSGVVSVLPLELFKADRLRARRPAVKRPFLLILDDIADPGNMGTLLRTALAADVESVLLTSNCVDCYSPKVVRAAAGAHVALPIEAHLSWQAIAEKVARHSGNALRVLLAEAGGTLLYYEQDLTLPFALIIGNEAHGPSQEARSLATLTVSIPLANGVESLNAAMAAGIVLFEAVRQSRQNM